MIERKPNWTKWKLTPDATAWQAVALSLDIDPGKVMHSADGWMAPGHFVSDEQQEFKDRLDVLIANVGHNDLLKPRSLSMNGGAYCTINIANFAIWANSVEWQIPSELSQLALVKSEKQQSETSHDCQLYSSPWLNIQKSAIAEFFDPRRNPDAKREEVVEWIKQAALKAGLPDSENLASAIFTLIKPENHDPKKRRG